jgi:hypothetical protein
MGFNHQQDAFGLTGTLRRAGSVLLVHFCVIILALEQ